MQMMGMCSTSFSNSTFLLTSLRYGSSSSSYHSHNQKNNTTFFLSFPFNRTLPSSSLPPLSQATHFTSLSVFPTINSNRLQASAFNKGRKVSTTVFEMDGSDDDDDEFFDFDDEFDGGDDDEDEGMLSPLGKMSKWFENKPCGFGEGKVYDTTIEDKLLEEIEQSRQAQIVNVNNLKSNPAKSGSKKNDRQNKKAEVVPSGIRVRVGNLPKKKNIHRDLKAAFDGVSGIINISPAVSGNKKTKDHVCKGFAFVDFKLEVDATRFVQNFSGQYLTFGKIQKQIKCEMMSSHSHNPAHERLIDNDHMMHEMAVSGWVDSPNADFDMNNSSSNLSLESVSDKIDDQDDEFDGVELREGRDNLSVISKSEPSNGDDMERTFKHAEDSISSNRLERIRALEKKLLGRGKQQRVPKEPKDQKLERIRSIEKKVLAKGNQQKVPKEQKVQKLDIPGSAKRLKIKEKALLTGVFSKYRFKTALTSKEES
ncbi:uncharacterized protein LOC111282202 [Durio zibethinus]|uniref:Uncharacterized protein LOC111282202 n=1 Tax=Durio zibethinus TaxID=66656 RepID=A0A6P5XE47_DURZI|nr:uncharacterized protein LOC111282202 [Durio zibethinus]